MYFRKNTWSDIRPVSSSHLTQSHHTTQRAANWHRFRINLARATFIKLAWRRKMLVRLMVNFINTLRPLEDGRESVVEQAQKPIPDLIMTKSWHIYAATGPNISKGPWGVECCKVPHNESTMGICYLAISIPTRKYFQCKENLISYII